MDKQWISLCKVNRPDVNNDIWMRRIADCIDGTLTVFVYDESTEQIFDNRRYIFRKDGPSIPESIGFWEWTERQNQFGKWQSNASFLANISPTEIILFDNLSSVEEIIETLKSGTTIPSYMSGNIMFSVKKDGKIKGVLCDLSSFTVRPGEIFYITIRSNIYTVPYYEFDESDIFPLKNRKVLKSVYPGEPIRMIPVFSVTDSIKQLLLSNMTWPVFKAKGITRSDWQKMKEFLDAIPKDSILDKLAQTYAMTIDEAQARVDSFLHNVEKYITAEDVNAETMVSMIECHSGLREKSIAAGEKQWKLTHTEQIEEAESQLETIRKSISATEDDKIHLLMEIEAAQEKLDQLRAEIVRNEALGRDTVDATRRKIADAQKNMAGFIAELSAFMPFGSFSHSDTAIDSQYIHPADRRYFENYLEDLIPDSEWEPIVWREKTEYLRLEPPFSRGYWKQLPDKDNRISLARFGEFNKQYVLYCFQDGTYYHKIIPEWKLRDCVSDTSQQFGEYRRIAIALLNKYGTLPEIGVKEIGGLMEIKLGYRLPPSEETFYKLYSWPLRYDFTSDMTQVFTRKMAKKAYLVFRHELEMIGYRFVEE